MDKIVVAQIAKPYYGMIQQWKEILSPEGISSTLLAAICGSDEQSIKILETGMEDKKDTLFIGNIYGHGTGFDGSVYDPSGYGATVVAQGKNGGMILEEPKLLGGIGDVNWGKQYHQQDRIYDSEAVAMACRAGMPGGSYMYGIEEPQAMKLTRTEEGKELLPRDDGLLNTLTTVDKDNHVAIPNKTVMPNYRIRKLTERECFRLMGVKDEDSANIAKNQTKSSQYHLAGDSIVTACLMAIFGEMLDMDWETKIRELEESICHESNS